MDGQHKNKKKRNQSARTLLSLITPVFAQYRSTLYLGFAALLCVDFCQLIVPRIIKKVIDDLASATATPQLLAKMGFFILLLALFVAVLRFFWRNLLIGFSRKLEQKLRDRIFSHVLKMDLPFFEKRTTGEIMAHISNDLTSVQMACGMGMVAAVDGFVMSVVALLFMLHIDPWLTLLSLAPMPFLALCTRVLSSKLHKQFSTVQEQFASLTEFSRSSLVSMRLIKAYVMEQAQEKEFNQLGKKYVQSNIQVAMIQGLLHPIATLVGNIGLLLVLFYGGKLTITGQITIGDFVAFITYLYMLVWPMMAVGWVANLVQRGLTSLDRIYSLLDTSPLFIEPFAKGLKKNHSIQGRFTIQHLNFTYPESSSQVLKDVSLDISQSIIGITGPTGSGKTTLLKLLAHLYPAPPGTIYFDGIDINSLQLDELRQHIAYVSQEPILFSDTIFENIRLARPDASTEEVIHFAKQADIHRDISAFSEGYQTLIGERGITLSGGQKQRITLARALLSKRKVLLIDDGLAAVDVETENRILAALKDNSHAKTVILVSHRVKLLARADRIVLIENGTVTRDATHAELLETSSFYQHMYNRQVKEEGEHV